MGLGERAKVLLLGTFHFAYPNLDLHKSEQQINILSPERQSEVEGLVRLLAAFRPTKVAVEVDLEKEEQLAQEYRTYRDGRFSLPASEVYQLGFRLAGLMNHERLYPINAWGRFYDPPESLLEYARKRLGPAAAGLSEEALYFSLWEDLFHNYMKLPRHDEELLQRWSLREHLLYLNSPEYISVSHGGYLTWVDAPPGDYTMVDYLSGWWYNRNLRIFANLKRITESPGDRILVIVGAGHLPILRHALQCSPKHELMEVSTYLSPSNP